MSFEERLAARLIERMIMLEPLRISRALAEEVDADTDVDVVHWNRDFKTAIIVTSVGVHVLCVGGFGLRYRLDHSSPHNEIVSVLAQQFPASHGAQTDITIEGRRGRFTYTVGLAMFYPRPYTDPNDSAVADLHGDRAREIVAAIDARVSQARRREETHRPRVETPGRSAVVEPLRESPSEAERLAHRVLFQLSRHPVSSPASAFRDGDELAEICRVVRNVTQLDDRGHVPVAVELERFVADAIVAGAATFDDVESLMHLDDPEYRDGPAGVHAFAMQSLVHRDEFGGDESGAFALWKSDDHDFTDLPVELSAWFAVCGVRMAAAGLLPPIPPP